VSQSLSILRAAVGLLLATVAMSCLPSARRIAIVIDPAAAPRVEFGAERLVEALKAVKMEAGIVRSGSVSVRKIHLETPHDLAVGREGFRFDLTGKNDLVITSGDDSGALYGCLELARRIRAEGGLPMIANFADKPAMALRGTCIGMQKTYILPGRKVYEYPYTPELFPFFYDKAFWQEYLDFLVANRMNTLYLWSGHPFASLVKLKDYPYAVEVPDDVFQKNVEMFRYITSECDRRGIWLVQMFYNIIVSKPFAEQNGITTQLSASTPLAADYTRKSIAEFVKQYPNVGLMVCLGEALKGVTNQVEWCTQVVLPGVKDGMKAAGLREEPPVVIRTHATDATVVMPAALAVYSNLCTESKYNGESLTTWEPRGKQQAIHLAMSKLGTHLVNVHILANLEPFRYGAQRFIQKCVVAARDRLGAKGIHLYPLSYWNWPDAPDIADPSLKQWRRDWIWFEAWARYSWNPDIPEQEDRAYWISRLTEIYGNADAAAHILDAYNDSGECAPRIIRRFGITEGNRQTLSLGMTLDELVNPEKYKAFSELWESQSPPGERLQEFAKREWNHEPHEGETPPQIIREILDYSSNAVASIDAAAPLVTKDREEFDRLRNDIYCIRAMSEFYAAKANAALNVLRYDYSKDVADMVQARDFLATSFEYYRRLASLTEKTYRFANGMQTSQRKIPVTGAISGVSTNFHWTQLVGLYKKELDDFQTKVDLLEREKASQGNPSAEDRSPTR
jgi:hypothetical protein